MVLKFANGQPRLLFGVNSDLTSWIEDHQKTQIVGEGLCQPGLSLDDYIDALGERDSMARRSKCIEIVDRLWGSRMELGPYPLQNELRKLEEHGRVFHNRYRDHSAHQLKVYVLGLFIYGTCPGIRTALRQEICPGIEDAGTPEGDAVCSEFILRWMAASLLHDIGYVLEHAPLRDLGEEPGHPAEALPDVLSELRIILSKPIAHTRHFNPRKSGRAALFSDRQEERANKELTQLRAYNPPQLKVISDLFNVNLPGATKRKVHDLKPKDFLTIPKSSTQGYFTVNLLDPLSKRAAASAFAVEENDGVKILQSYYTIARRFHPGDHDLPGYWDHGISSALIFLQVWLAYARKISLVRRHSGAMKEKGAVAQRSLKAIDDSRIDPAMSETVWAAAGAIALHNINKERFKRDSRLAVLEEGEVLPDLEHFQIHLNDNPESGHRGTPLAFLLSLADALQDWDRPAFSPLLDHKRDSALVDVGFSIQYSGGNIRLLFREDVRKLGRENLQRIHDDEKDENFEDSKFGKMKMSLYARLQNDIVESLVEVDCSSTISADVVPLFKEWDERLLKKWLEVVGPARETEDPPDATRETENPPDPPEVTELTPEQLNKIGSLTAQRPDASAINICHNSTTEDPKQCTLQGQAVLAVSQLDRTGEAFEDLKDLLLAMEPVSNCLDSLDRALGSSQAAILPSFKDLSNRVRVLLAAPEQFDRTCSYKKGDVSLDSRLCMILERRIASITAEMAADFVTGLKDIDQLAQDRDRKHLSAKQWRAKIASRERDISWMAFQVRAIVAGLREVTGDRKAFYGKEGVLKKAFPEGLDVRNLGGHFSAMNRSISKLTIHPTRAIWSKKELNAK